MKMKSCVHWNYGYYGPKKGCMVGKKCKCEDYERRSTAKKRAATHKKIMADRARKDSCGSVLGVSKGFIKSKKCVHELIEKVDSIQIHTCSEGSRIIDLPKGCPKACPYRELP